MPSLKARCGPAVAVGASSGPSPPDSSLAKPGYRRVDESLQGQGVLNIERE